MITADIRQRCETIARLEQQRKELAEQIKEHKAAAKDAGYDVPLITKTVSLMLKDTEKQKKALDQHNLFDSYLAAVGLLPEETPKRNSAEEAKAEYMARNAWYPGAPTGEELARALIGDFQSQPSVASQAVERSAGDGPSQQTPPAAPIQEQASKGFSAGEGEPLTSDRETVDGLPLTSFDVLEPKSTDLAHSFEHQPSAPTPQTADQAAGVETRIPPAADLSADMDIPDFLRRTKRLEVA